MKPNANQTELAELKAKYSKAKMRIERLLAEIVEKTLENTKLHEQLTEHQRNSHGKSPFPTFRFGKFAADEQSEQRIRELTEANNELRAKLSDCSFSLKSLVLKLEEKIERENYLEQKVAQLSENRRVKSLSTNDFELRTLTANLEPQTNVERSAEKENVLLQEVRCLKVRTDDIQNRKPRGTSLKNKTGFQTPSGTSLQKVDTKANNETLFSANSNAGSFVNEAPSIQNNVYRNRQTGSPSQNKTDCQRSLSYNDAQRMFEMYEHLIDELNKRVKLMEDEKHARECENVETQITVKKLKIENNNLRAKLLSKLEPQSTHESTTFEKPSSDVQKTITSVQEIKAKLKVGHSVSAESFLKDAKEIEKQHFEEVKLLMQMIQELERRLTNALSDLSDAQQRLQEKTVAEKSAPNLLTSAENNQLVHTEFTTSPSQSVRSSSERRSAMLFLSESFVYEQEGANISANRLYEQTIQSLQSKLSAVEEKHRVLLANFQQKAEDTRELVKQLDEKVTEVDLWKNKYTQMQFRFDGLSTDFLKLKEAKDSKDDFSMQTSVGIVSSEQLNQLRDSLEAEMKLKFDRELRQVKQGLEIKQKWEIKALTEHYEQKMNNCKECLRLKSLQLQNEQLQTVITELTQRVATAEAACNEMTDELTGFSFREFSLREELSACQMQLALQRSYQKRPDECESEVKAINLPLQL